MATISMEINAEPPPPPSLGRLLNFTTGAMNRLCQDMLAEHDLQLGHWVILSALWRRDGLSTSELARYSGNTLPAVSRLIDRMAKKGLVVRESDPSDRRTARIRTTAEGRALAHLQHFYADVNDRLLAGFSEGETRTLFTLLERVLENARAASAPSGAPEARPAAPASRARPGSPGAAARADGARRRT